MLNFDRFETDTERTVVLAAEYFDLHGDLHPIAFAERLDHAIRPTDRHLN